MSKCQSTDIILIWNGTVSISYQLLSLSVHILYVHWFPFKYIVVSSLVLKLDTVVIFGSSDQTWTLYFTCEGAPGGKSLIL